jgi:hypothetical protein
MKIVAPLVLSTFGVVFVAELPDKTALAQNEVRVGRACGGPRSELVRVDAKLPGLPDPN